MLVRIERVVPLEGFLVRLELTDGTCRTVDLEQYLRGPIFEPVRHNLQTFREVRVDPELGTIVWPNGADIDPDVLIRSLIPAWKIEDEVAEFRP